MSKENAQKLFAELKTNKEFREKIHSYDTPADIVKAAVEAGYDVTEAELAEAEQELRKQVAQRTDAQSEELSPDKLENAAGGLFFFGETAPDGHEMGCLVLYHTEGWQLRQNISCKDNFFCYRSSYENMI